MDNQKINGNKGVDINYPPDQIIIQNGTEVRHSPSEKRLIRKKKFIERNSMLTDIYQNKHVNTMYNIFIVITIYIILINLLYEWRDQRTLSFGLVDLAQKFNKIEIALVCWLVIKFLTVLTFPAFKMWTNIYYRTKYKKMIGTIFILCYCAYMIGIHLVTSFSCIKYDFSVLTSFALLLETLRLGMKSYAYIRVNVGQVIVQKEFNSPTFGHFMYFLWCPTLLYRDSYPLTSTRNWNRVLKHFLEFAACVYSMVLVNNQFLQKLFVDYGKSEVTLFNIILRWIEITIIVPPLFYFYGFYMLQHAWFNMFAELLRFGDRAFYRDWWTSKSMKEYYRGWSGLVHEWLYEYMYTDLYRYITRQSFTISSLTTIIISAVVHEYVLVISMKFFFPALLVLYLSLGILYMYIELGNNIGNCFVWFNLVIGMSLLHLLYLMEYYGRINCPNVLSMNTTATAYYYTPMILKCNNIVI